VAARASTFHACPLPAPGLCLVYRFAEAREVREFEQAFNVCADPEIVFIGAED
jgi:hypothetical protein